LTVATSAAPYQDPPSSVKTFDDASQVYANMVSTNAAPLPVLYRAAQLLGTVFDLDELLDDILALIFEAVPARRGFVLILEDTGPVVRAQRSHNGEHGAPPLSWTLVNRVLEQGDAMMTLDAQADSRFDTSISIVAHAIRSAMCVPLCGRQSTIGALYVDSGVLTAEFNQEQLKLLMAIGRVVGVAVENAQLYQRNLAQERLAAIGLAMANVGHCVKNILSGMLGGVHFVECGRRARDWTHIESGWPMLRRAINRIELLVLNLLTFTKDDVAFVYGDKWKQRYFKQVGDDLRAAGVGHVGDLDAGERTEQPARRTGILRPGTPFRRLMVCTMSLATTA
jgi:hypothetical protein